LEFWYVLDGYPDAPYRYTPAAAGAVNGPFVTALAKNPPASE
jgi:hypothetical protein